MCAGMFCFILVRVLLVHQFALPSDVNRPLSFGRKRYTYGLSRQLGDNNTVCKSSGLSMIKCSLGPNQTAAGVSNVDTDSRM